MPNEDSEPIIKGAAFVQVALPLIALVGAFSVLLFQVSDIAKTTKPTSSTVHSIDTRLTVVETKMSMIAKQGEK